MIKRLKKITPFLILFILGLAGAVVELFTGHWGPDGWSALAAIPLAFVFVVMLLIDMLLKVVRASTWITWTVEMILLFALLYYWIVR